MVVEVWSFLLLMQMLLMVGQRGHNKLGCHFPVFTVPRDEAASPYLSSCGWCVGVRQKKVGKGRRVGGASLVVLLVGVGFTAQPNDRMGVACRSDRQTDRRTQEEDMPFGAAVVSSETRCGGFPVANEDRMVPVL